MSADVLLVGAGGPIGAALERRLSASGQRARRTSRRGPEVLDVARHDEVRAHLAQTRPGAVAYLVNGDVGDETAIETATGDLRALVRASAAAGVSRIVLSSSGAVYGDAARAPRAESDARAGSSPYARLKGRLEDELIAACDAEGVAWTVLRIFNVFGPGCAASLVNRLTDGSLPTLLVTPSFVRDYVHVDDVADAFARAFVEPGNGVFNVASGIPMTNAELAATARPGSYVNGAPPRDGFRTYSVGDPARIEQAWDWRARIPVGEWMRSTSPS